MKVQCMKVQFGFSNINSFTTLIVKEEQITKKFLNDLLSTYNWVKVLDEEGCNVICKYL